MSHNSHRAFKYFQKRTFHFVENINNVNSSQLNNCRMILLRIKFFENHTPRKLTTLTLSVITFIKILMKQLILPTSKGSYTRAKHVETFVVSIVLQLFPPN